MKPGLYQGDDEIPLGWISRRFDSKVPCPTIVWKGTFTGKTEYLTVFKYNFD